MMTVRDLIEELELLNPDAEVRIAHQPNYPLWCGVARVVPGTDEASISFDSDALFVYITEGSDDGYASTTLWEGE